MPRVGEVRIDCAKVRKLLEDCALTPAAAERKMRISHSVLHRMMGGAEKSRQTSVNAHEGNAQAILELARNILGRSATDIPLSAILWSEIGLPTQQDHEITPKTTVAPAPSPTAGPNLVVLTPDPADHPRGSDHHIIEALLGPAHGLDGGVATDPVIGPTYLRDILQGQLTRAIFSAPSDLSEWMGDATLRMKRILGPTDGPRMHPIFLRSGIRIAADSFAGRVHRDFLHQVLHLPRAPLTVACPSSWVAPISVFLEVNCLLRPQTGFDLLNLKVDTTIGTELVELIEKTSIRPEIIVVADGAIRSGSAPCVMRDYEYLMPLFRDSIVLLRTRKRPGQVARLSAAHFCVNSAGQECMALREILGYDKEERYGFQRASEAQHLISQLDYDKGLLDSAVVARYYVNQDSEHYFIDDEFNNYYYVSMYCRRDLGWSVRQKVAFANVVAAKWVALQDSIAVSETLSRLRNTSGFLESMSRAAVGYAET